MRIEPISGEFCNQEFEKANQLLHAAERIIFLGFGFHPDNIRRFNFFTPENVRDKEVFATANGVNGIDLDQLRSRLEPFGFETPMFKGQTCNALFSQVVALE